MVMRRTPGKTLGNIPEHHTPKRTPTGFNISAQGETLGSQTQTTTTQKRTPTGFNI